MFPRLSVRWRLLLAFLGVSAFAVLAAGAGTYAFRQVAGALERIIEQRVPIAVAALQLSRQAERIVAAAPAQLTARSQAQHQAVSAAVNAEVGGLERLLGELKGGAVDASDLAAIEATVDGLRRNLDALEALVARRLSVADRKDELVQRLSGTMTTAQRVVAPGILVMDTKIAAWRRAMANPSPETTAPAVSGIAETIAANIPMQKAQLEITTIYDGLLKAAATAAPDELRVMAFPLKRSLSTLQAMVSDLPEAVPARLARLVDQFARLIEGPDSILDARDQELALVAEGERLLAENTTLSGRLTAAVDVLVDAADRNIRAAGVEAFAVQRFGNGVLLGVVALSLLSSFLIVWLYVDRNLVARLTALSGSMLAIAGGNLRAALPAGGGDEIGRMAEALAVFRDTAVEVEEKNLREVASARQRLIDAIESISEGFALYDAEDRLVLCNSRYGNMLYPGRGTPMVPGTPFEAVVRRAAELGLIEEARGRTEAWVAERLAIHLDPSGTIVEHRSGDRWIQVSERRIAGGGTVAVYTDITELKQREAQLELARDQAMEATRAKSQFLANMSHELRTPLNAIIGYSEMLIELADEAGQGDFAPDLDKIRTAGRHLLGLINDILDLSKIEAGRMDLFLETFEVSQMVRDVQAIVQPLVEKNGNTLIVQGAADLVLVQGRASGKVWIVRDGGYETTDFCPLIE
jgi:adenylate cyclase